MRYFLILCAALFLVACAGPQSADYPGDDNSRHEGNQPPAMDNHGPDDQGAPDQQHGDMSPNGQGGPGEKPGGEFGNTAPQRDKKHLPAEVNMQRGDNYFAKQRWTRAADRYQQVTFEKSSPFLARAQFRLAECYFNLKRYSEARTEYDALTRQFPDSPDLQTAYYKIALSWYEDSLPAQYTQDETKMAISAFNEYLDRYETADSSMTNDAYEHIRKCEYKLVEKDYNNGYIYYRMYDYSSALMYFNDVLKLNMSDRVDRLSLYYSAKIYLKRQDMPNAKTTIQNLVSKYPLSREAKRLKKYLNQG